MGEWLNAEEELNCEWFSMIPAQRRLLSNWFVKASWYGWVNGWRIQSLCQSDKFWNFYLTSPATFELGNNFSNFPEGVQLVNNRSKV